MNVVVLLPALASFFTPAVADGALCFEGTCLLGWVWSILALTLASAWIVRRWQTGVDEIDGTSARLAPAVAPAGLVSPARGGVDRSNATDLVAVGLALRAPPTTDMAARRAERASRRQASSPPSCSSRPTGTPATPPGQHPPA